MGIFDQVLQKHKDKQTTSPSAKFSLVAEERPGLMTKTPLAGDTISAPLGNKYVLGSPAQKADVNDKLNSMFSKVTGGKEILESFQKPFKAIAPTFSQRAEQAIEQNPAITTEDLIKQVSEEMGREGIDPKTGVSPLDTVAPGSTVIAAQTKKISGAIIRKFAKETSEKAVQKELTKLVPELPKDQISALSNQIAKLDSEAKIDNLIKQTVTENRVETALANAYETAKDDIIQRLKEPVPVRPGQTDILADETFDATDYLIKLEKANKPDSKLINEGLEILQLQGKPTQPITNNLMAAVDGAKKVVRQYIQDPATGRLAGSKRVNDIQPVETQSAATKPTNLLEEARKYDTPEAFIRAREEIGIVDEWGTQNQFLQKTGGNQLKDIELVIKGEKPAAMMNISESDVAKFKNVAETQGLSIDFLKPLETEGVEMIVAKDDKALKKLSDALTTPLKEGEQYNRRLGLALGYRDLGEANIITRTQLEDIWKQAKGQQSQAFAGGIAGVEENEDGDIEVDPTKAFLGIAAAGILGKGFIGRKGMKEGTQDALRADASRLAQQQPQGKIPLPTKGQTKYPLTSDVLSKSLTDEYQKVAKTSIDDVEKHLSPTNIDPKKSKEYSNFRKAINEAWTKTVEFIQDDMYRVRQLVNDPTVKVSDDTDPYLAELLFHGRVGARLTEARDTVIAIDTDLVSTAKRNGVPDSDMTLMVNKYLHARHAPERNAALGDGAAGLTTADANQILGEIDTLPYADDVKRIAEDIQKLNNRSLDVLRENQVIDQELYDTLKTKYKNHVPLQRILEETEDVGEALTSRGFDVRSTGIKRAKGSDRQVADILANVVTNYEQAVIRAEKNRVDLATLQFARDNAELGLFKEYKAKPIGKTFDGKIITETITDPTILALRENGKQVYLKIADENLAMALKGVNRHQVPPYMKFVQSFTRFYSGLQTRFNPEFAFPNKLRDLQEALVYAGSRSELGFSGGVRASLDQRAYKDVLDHIRGVDTEGSRIYKQMIEDGGTTGGMSLSTREQVELDIANIRKLNRSAPRRAATKIIEYVDNFNQVFEDSTRLSLYKEAIDRGVSRKRAAEIAKEASVNFNKFGRGGPIINALWMFSNASIQGTTKMLRSLKNPKVAATVTASVGSAVYASGEWNDRIDPDWRNKVTEWDRINALILVLPAKDDQFNYVAIPVGWGIKPIKVSMEYAYDLTQGKGELPLDIANGIMAAIVNSYNPVGGTDLFSSVMPTILDIPSEIARNKAWHGGKIKPDWDQNAPESIRYFTSLKDSTTGETAVQFSKGLSGVGIEISPADIYYAYQGYIGGAGRTATDFVNTMISAGQGKMPEPNNIPVWSRFVRQRDNEEIGVASKEFEAIKKRLEEQSRERFYLNQDAEDAYAQLRALPKDQAAVKFDEIAERDPDLADKIKSVIDEERLGLTFSERLIKQLGVSNGERADYIYEKLEQLKTKEEKAALWDEYTEKGLISDNVAEQIMERYK